VWAEVLFGFDITVGTPFIAPAPRPSKWRHWDWDWEALGLQEMNSSNSMVRNSGDSESFDESEVHDPSEQGVGFGRVQ
jgi:hypothetical protein